MQVVEVLQRQRTQDGDGVNIARVADFSGRSLDPFLMIDELKSDNRSDYIGGFPPHPHRGIETFTYMLKGGFEHQDQMGNKEVIKDGDVQWMSTGFGVVHSEMPVADSEGLHGFQIWLNMPAKHKLRPAKYQDSTNSGLPLLEKEGVYQLKALAGSWQLDGQEVSSPLMELAANGAIADLRIEAGANVSLDRKEYQQFLVFIYLGGVNGYKEGQLLIVDSQQLIQLQADSNTGLLLFSGNKIGEPVAHLGPFVMNTQAELRQAVEDYQSGKFGTI